METRSVCSLLALVALAAAPLAAQDTTTTRKDTAAVRHDTVTVIKDTTTAPAFVPPAAPGAAPAPAPVAPATQDNAVRPGMTEADVRARWGDPIAVRTANDWTYLFYRNHEERSIGYYDVVMLQRGQVMDAIVRSPDHVYAGQSSSPPDRMPEFTPPKSRASDTTGAAVTGVRVKPSP